MTLVLPGAWKCATCLMIKTPQTWRSACTWLKRRWVTHDSWALSCVLLLTDIDIVEYGRYQLQCFNILSQAGFCSPTAYIQHDMNTSATLPHVTATGVKSRSFRAGTSTSQGSLQVSTAEWITPWVRWMPYTKRKPRAWMLPCSAGRHRLRTLTFFGGQLLQ